MKLGRFLSICSFPEVIFQNVLFFEYESGIVINTITEVGKRWIMSNVPIMKKAARELVLDRVIIYHRGKYIWIISRNQKKLNQRLIKELKEKMMNSIEHDKYKDIEIDALDLSRPHLIMTELQNLKYPVYITLLGFEESPFYNEAEARRMIGLPPSKFTTYSHELNYSDELANRNRLLHIDGQLRDYVHKGMRWYWDGDFWRKKEMSFVIDTSLCEFNNQPARIGIIKQEEELRKFVD